MGVVYHANYFVWFEVGRCDLLRTLGLSYRDLEKDGIALPVISASCEYQHAIHYDDHITVVTRGTIVSPVRLEFEYNITSCLLYTSPSPRDGLLSRMPSSA